MVTPKHASMHPCHRHLLLATVVFRVLLLRERRPDETLAARLRPHVFVHLGLEPVSYKRSLSEDLSIVLKLFFLLSYHQHV